MVRILLSRTNGILASVYVEDKVYTKTIQLFTLNFYALGAIGNYDNAK